MEEDAHCVKCHGVEIWLNYGILRSAYIPCTCEHFVAIDVISGIKLDNHLMSLIFTFIILNIGLLSVAILK